MKIAFGGLLLCLKNSYKVKVKVARGGDLEELRELALKHNISSHL